MSDRDTVETSQQEWLGAKWSTWGCAGLMGSLAIALLAIVTVIYGIFTIPSAFGPEGILSPDPELMPPFDVPPQEEALEGIPPIGVPEFTTGQPLRITEHVLFMVTLTALDWSPPPPQTPEIEYTVARVQLVNNGASPLPLGPGHFQMEVAWGGILEPVQEIAIQELIVDQEVQPGQTAEANVVFARQDIRQVRRYLIYDPPYREGTIRILLVP